MRAFSSKRNCGIGDPVTSRAGTSPWLRGLHHSSGCAAVNQVLHLATALAILGAADTIYYHEWRARLPGMGRAGATELQLHAYRDFVYAILFAALPWFSWQGGWSAVLALLLLTEVILTLWDFVVEDWIRKPLGGVYHGERIMHAIMGIVYGACCEDRAGDAAVVFFAPRSGVCASACCCVRALVLDAGSGGRASLGHSRSLRRL